MTAITGKTSATLTNLGNVEAAKPFNKPFADQGLHMAFSYPANFGLEQNQQNSSVIVSVVDAKTSVGFQVEASPFDDADTTITIDRIRRDLPDLAISQAEPINIAGSKPGLAFVSTHGSQLTREVWFAKDGYIYQITAPLEFDAVTKKMLTTWKFI